MGYRKSTYIGPYIDVTGKKQISVIKIKRVCPNHPKIESNNKYCSHCGTEITSVEYTETQTLTTSKFLHKNFDDCNLWVPESHSVMIPTIKIPKQIHIDNDDSDNIDLYKKQDLIQEQIDWFENECKNEIKLTKETFGNDNVNICWGVVTYWS